MQHETRNETVPFNASVETALLGSQAWQSANHAQVKAVNNKLDTIVESVHKLGDCLGGGLLTVESQQLSRQDLAQSPVSVAHDLLWPGLQASPVAAGSQAAVSPMNSATKSVEASSFGDADTVAQLATATGTLPGKSPMQDPKASPHSNYRMRIKHDGLDTICSEWHGLNEFADECGGIAGRDLLFQKQGPSWYQHLNPMHHSRNKRTVEAIQKFAEQENASPFEACAVLQPAFEASKCSVGNFVKHCQAINPPPKKQSRGWKKKEKND